MESRNMGEYRIVYKSGDGVEFSMDVKAVDNEAIIECSKIFTGMGYKIVRIEVIF